MVLVDSKIIQRSGEIFIKGYHEENVKPISYDIHVKEIIVENISLNIFKLQKICLLHN